MKIHEVVLESVLGEETLVYKFYCGNCSKQFQSFSKIQIRQWIDSHQRSCREK